MDLLSDDFLGVLEKQTELYQSLLSALYTEHWAIIESNMDKLNDSNNEKAVLVSKICDLEDQRSKMLDMLADSLKCPVQELTLEKLAQFSESPHCNRLKICRANLSSLLKRVREANDRNRYLFMHAIELAKGSMTLLNNLATSNAVYYRSGKIQNTDQNGTFFSGDI